MEKLMRADEMQRSVNRIVALLKQSQILDIIRQCRVASSAQKPTSLVRLGHAGAVLMEATQNSDQHTVSVLKSLHLDTLTSPGYWRNLLAETTEESVRQAELVRLYSRVLFASNHLPSLTTLLAGVDSGANPRPTADEQLMTIKLADAGEKASDPDRLARAIDGIDMLYSACASLAKKPAMDLQLLSVSGQSDRDIKFLGDNEAIQAVKTIVESIPNAIVNLDSDEDIDIQFLVQSLPVFDHLKVLQKLGTYTPSDLQDIRDTMHQGVLLSLESGVILLYSDDHEAENEPSTIAANGAVSEEATGGASSRAGGTKTALETLPSAQPRARVTTVRSKTKSSTAVETDQINDQATSSPSGQAATQSSTQSVSAGEAVATGVPVLHRVSGADAASDKTASAESDEYYEQYLKERERLQSGQDMEPSASAQGNGDDSSDDKRDSAIASLLRGLKK